MALDQVGRDDEGALGEGLEAGLGPDRHLQAAVENVLQHTESAPGVRLEFDGSTITVAVEDASHTSAGLRERPGPDEVPSGLRIIAALCRAWGNSPTPSGKTVWAVIGPENRL